jgi:hypothetical protein
MANFDEWDRYADEEMRGPRQTPPPAPPPPPTPDGFGNVIEQPFDTDPQPTGDGPTGDGDPYGMGTFTPPSYSGPMRPSFNFPAPPKFNPRMFMSPTLDEAKNEPGYQFRLQSGTDALDRSAAARGTLRTGNTLRDIVEYGQNFGEQAYQTMFDRALRAYQAYYQGERDKFMPQFQDYQNRFGAEQQSGMAGFDLFGDIYQNDWEAAQRNEDRILQTTMGNPLPPDASAY